MYNYKEKKTIYFADLFAGIGGFHHAFLNAIKNSDLDYKYEIKCKLISEIDNYAKKVYSKEFNIDSKFIKDINLINPIEDMKNINIVFCGFPCQSFSLAGNKLGFKDENRGGLIFKVIKLVKETTPKIILLENVKHLIKHNNSKTFEKIIGEFRDFGYITTEKPLVLSPWDWKIKQDRKRIFIPLVHKSICQNDYLVKKHDKLFEKELKEMKKNILQKKVSKKYFIDKDLENKLLAWKEFVDFFNRRKIKIPVIWLDEMLKENFVENIKMIEKPWYKKYIQEMKKFYSKNKCFIDYWVEKYKPLNWKLRRDKKLEWQAGFDTKFNDAYLQLRQSGLRFRKNNCFPTLVATVQVPIICQNNKWRKLTTLEVSKLQSFPENHYICKNEFQAYKQYGNSINVKVAEWVIRNFLLSYMEKIYD